MITKKSKKAFTLIEVLIAVMLLAIAGAALMQVSINNKNNFELTANRVIFDEEVSIPLTHRDKKYHKTTKDLYTYLSAEYNLTNDEIIKFLKSKKFSYEQKNFSVIKPFEDENESEISLNPNQDQTNIPSLTINIDKITIFDKENSFTAYTMRLQ